jgi:hypothetical protein
MVQKIMKHKLMTLTAILLAATLIMNVQASYSLSDGIDGYVYGNGMPAEGITVWVFNSADALEGYGVNDDDSQGMFGTDITDASGYFHIAWLYAHGGTYKVIAETPVGNITKYVTVYCGGTTRVCFEYSCGNGMFTIGYWKNHPDAWPVTELTIGGITYDMAGLMTILWNAKSKDATEMLAAQLVAAKLNVATGAYAPTEVLDAITDADAFLAMYPIGSDPQDMDRQYALDLKDILDGYNNSGED